MSIISDEVAVDAGSARTRRGRWVIAAAVTVAVVVSAAIGAAIAIQRRHLDHEYGPIQSGPFVAPYPQRNIIRGRDASTPRLAATPGATARIIEAITNRGTHSVKITSIQTDDIVTTVRWSAYRAVPGGDIIGKPTRWQDFPATVPANGLIRLLVTVHHPDHCTSLSAHGGEVDYRGEHIVHWQSLLHSHTTETNFGASTTILRVCSA